MEEIGIGNQIPSQNIGFCDSFSKGLQPCRYTDGVAFCFTIALSPVLSYTLGISIIYYSYFKEKARYKSTRYKDNL